MDVGQKKCREQDEYKEYKKTLSEAATGCFVKHTPPVLRTTSPNLGEEWSDGTGNKNDTRDL